MPDSGVIKKKPTANGYLRVKMLPKDPLVAREEDLWPEDVDVEAPTAGDGPSSARVCVVDYNADTNSLFEPARLLKDRKGYKGIAAIGKGTVHLQNFTFHQVNVWAVIEKTLASLEDEKALARPIPWASGLGRLLVLPHAGYDENAFYDRDTGALHFFYFEGPDGEPVYTCLSRDIVAHELGHAVLDGLKPGYNEVCSAETAAFHEYFGDAIAMSSSLQVRTIALRLTRDAPAKLEPKNIVSAIASEFGAALHGLAKQDYLRGAWKLRTMKQLKGNLEEHDLSEVLTGVYYELLQYMYVKNLDAVLKEAASAGRKSKRNQQHCMRALIRASGQTTNVMLRALDYCPPVDLRFNDYARALLRAQEVAYPFDEWGVRGRLEKEFGRRGLQPAADTPRFNQEVTYELRNEGEIDTVTATPADAYRFIDKRRELFNVPVQANLRIVSVYSTRKKAASGYRPPRERIIEFAWTEDVELKGQRFGALAGTFVDLHCGGTLVFDGSGNFLHAAIVPSSPGRKRDLLDYVAWLVEQGSIGVADGLHGVGAPGASAYRIAATVTNGRLRLSRNAAMRHSRGHNHRH